MPHDKSAVSIVFLSDFNFKSALCSSAVLSLIKVLAEEKQDYINAFCIFLFGCLLFLRLFPHSTPTRIKSSALPSKRRRVLQSRVASDTFDKSGKEQVRKRLRRCFCRQFCMSRGQLAPTPERVGKTKPEMYAFNKARWHKLKQKLWFSRSEVMCGCSDQLGLDTVLKIQFLTLGLAVT